MIAPPDQTVKPLRPEGNFGTQITVALDDGYRTLWLNGITTSASDIFRTPLRHPHWAKAQQPAARDTTGKRLARSG